MPPKLKIINLLVAAVIVLAACSTNTNQPPEVELPAPQQVVVENAPEQIAAEPTTEEAAPPAVVEESAGSYELGFTEGDPNLKATNPATVNLAAGKPQLIEFFAFW